MANYKEYNQEQLTMIQFDPEIHFAEGSFVRYVNDYFEENVDIKVFASKRKNDFGGAGAFNPIMLLKIIFYAFSQGIYSMRELSEKYLMRHIDFIYLSGYQYVEHSTLSIFINMYREEITDILTDAVYIANNLGYVSKDLIALDGSKVKANANKKFTWDYEVFKKKKKIYEKMTENLLKRAERLEAKYKKGDISKQEVEKERKNIERLENSYKNALGRIKEFLKETKEEDKDKKVNLIDPDSALMEKDKKIFQGYNCQISISDSGIIVSNEVNGKASDRGQLEERIQETSEDLRELKISKEEIKQISYLADKGYSHSEQVGNLVREGYDIYIPMKEYGQEVSEGENIRSKHCKIYKEGNKCYLECPGGQKMISNKVKTKKDLEYSCYVFYPDKEICKLCEYYNRCAGRIKRGKEFEIGCEVFNNLDEIEEIKEKMNSGAGKDKYNKRFWLGEFGFGIMKEHRRFRQFLVRGIEKVRLQWAMVCGAFNLSRIWALAESG